MTKEFPAITNTNSQTRGLIEYASWIAGSIGTKMAMVGIKSATSKNLHRNTKAMTQNMNRNGLPAMGASAGTTIPVSQPEIPVSLKIALKLRAIAMKIIMSQLMPVLKSFVSSTPVRNSRNTAARQTAASDRPWKLFVKNITKTATIMIAAMIS